MRVRLALASTTSRREGWRRVEVSDVVRRLEVIARRGTRIEMKYFCIDHYKCNLKVLSP